MANDVMYQFSQGFKRAWIGTYRYGYFAPIQALFLALTRKGGYVWHFKALYRLSFGKWDLVALRKAQRNRGSHN